MDPLKDARGVPWECYQVQRPRKGIRVLLRVGTLGHVPYALRADVESIRYFQPLNPLEPLNRLISGQLISCLGFAPYHWGKR